MYFTYYEIQKKSPSVFSPGRSQMVVFTQLILVLTCGCNRADLKGGKAGPFHAFQLLPCQSFRVRWVSQLCGSLHLW